MRQIRIVSRAIRQRDIKVTVRLIERIVTLAMQRERKHRIITRQNGCGTVALMHIEINDRHAADTPFSLHQPGCDRGIIEHAKALSAIAVRMVCAARQIDRDAVGNRRPAGSDRRSRGTSGALHHLGRPGKSNGFLFGFAERAAADPMNVIRVVCKCQHTIGGVRRFFNDHLWQRAHDGLAQHPVLLHREAMPGRQGKYETVAVEGFQDVFVCNAMRALTGRDCSSGR